MMRNRVKFAITTNDILYFICWSTLFLPPIVNRVSHILGTAFTWLGFFSFAMLFLFKDKRVNRQANLILLVLIVAWGFFVTALLSPSQTVSFIKDVIFPLVEVYYLARWSFASKNKKGLKSLYAVCTCYIVLDFISILLFPHGIFRSAVGSSVERAQWIFGSKNNAALFLLLFIVFIAFYEYFIYKRWKRLWLLAAMSFLSIALRGNDGVSLMGGSSTGVIAIAATLLLIEYYVIMKNRELVTVNGNMVLLGITSLYLFVLLGGTLPFIQKIIINIFHKTITYSGRSRIWLTTLKYINKSPWFGHGEVDFFSTVYIDGRLSFTSYTYNAVLKILLNYGLIGMVLIVAYILSVSRSKRIDNEILFSGLIGLLIIGLMNEIPLKFMLILPVIMMCTEIENSQDKKRRKMKVLMKRKQ